MKRRKTVIKNSLRCLIALAAVGVLVATQDLSSLLEGAKQLALLPMVAGIGLFIAANCLVAVRWCVLLAALGIHFPLFSAIKVTFVGLFYNNVLLSAIGGDLLRGWYVTKYTEKRLEAAFSVIADRICGLTACFLMAVIGLLFSKGLFDETTKQTQKAAEDTALPLWLKSAIFLGAALLITAVVLLILYKSGKLNHLIDNFYSHLKRFIAAAVVYIKSPLAVLKAIAITLFGQSLTVTAIYIAASPLKIDVGLNIFFIVFPLSWILGTLPISPGGLGVLELGIVAMFAAMPQVTTEQALMLALCQRFIFIAGSIPGFVIHLTGKHLPKAEFAG